MLRFHGWYCAVRSPLGGALAVSNSTLADVCDNSISSFISLFFQFSNNGNNSIMHNVLGDIEKENK